MGCPGCRHLLKDGRQCEPDRAADRIDAWPGCGAQDGTTAILLDFDDTEVEQIVDDVLPFRHRCAVGGQSIEQLLAQQQGEEGAADVAADCGIGAVEHHSESTESYWLHTAGLKVVVPSTPSDAYWLLRQAIVSRDPVIYLEPKRRYWTREVVDTSTPALPIGRAAVRRIGTDVTVLTYGSLVATALSAADLAEQHGWSLEVVDLRSLNPLDFDTVADSVRKTGRAIVMHEGPRTLGFGAELAARIQEELFYDLEAPVLRATGFDTPYPPARLEKLWLPGPDRLLDCVERAMGQP